MQLCAQQHCPAPDADDFDDNSSVASNDLGDLDDDCVDVFPDLQHILGDPNDMDLDFYTHEGLDTFRDIIYIDIIIQFYSSDSHQFQSLHLSLETLQSQMRLFIL